MAKNYRNLKWLLGLLFLAVVLLFYFLGLHQKITFDNLHAYAESWTVYVRSHYWKAVALYMLFFISATLFFIPVTIFITILGGFIFGVTIGSLLTVISATTGALFLFLLIRFLFGDWVQQRYARKLKQFNAHIEKYGVRYLIALQWLPFTPTFFINLLAGVSRISLVTFAWGTAVGLLPGTIVYSWLGYRMHFVHTSSQGLLLIVATLLIFGAMILIVPLLFRLMNGLLD